MEAATIVFKQIMTMFLFMLAGYVLVKSGKLSEQGSRDLASMLIWLVIPATLVNSFCIAFSPEKLAELVQSSLLGALALGLAILIARLLLHRRPIDEFAASFSNAGFMGFPVAHAIYGPDGVFFAAMFVVAINLVVYTLGVALLITLDEKAASEQETQPRWRHRPHTPLSHLT